MIVTLNILVNRLKGYRMAGNFRGSQFSRFSRLTGDPRKLNPRNKKPKRTRARAITGGVAIVVHAAAQLD